MTRRKIIRISIVISLVMHFLLFGYSTVLWIPGLSSLAQQTKAIFNVSSVELEPQASSAHHNMQSYLDSLKFRGGDVDSLPAGFETPDEAIEAPRLEDQELQSLWDNLSQTNMPAIQEDKERDRKKLPVRTREVQESTVSSEIFEPGRLVQLIPVQEIELPQEFEEQMAAFTPQAPAKTIYSRLKERSQGPTKADSSFVSIDRFIDVQLHTWTDPGDGQGYFKIAIRPGPDAASLESIPKEMVFLIDASLSIKERRLDAFKKGIEYCLKNLNPEDRFHLVTFKDTINRYSQESLVSNTQTVSGALDFLGQLEPSERTDIYEAVLKSLGEKPSILPSYVVLLSDGRPTLGIQSSTKIIGQIREVNETQRPIFAFSSGRRVNRYLLDFLAYQNRGWSEYAKNTGALPQRMSSFYDKIRNPLLLNLRYQFSGVNGADVFPKHLPDFFKNAEFVVYGRYRNEREFSMRVFGEIGDKTKEFIFKRDLGQAQAGSRVIARSWAFNRIYHLIGEMSPDSTNKDLFARIDALSQKFGLQTPYALGESSN